MPPFRRPGPPMSAVQNRLVGTQEELGQLAGTGMAGGQRAVQGVGNTVPQRDPRGPQGMFSRGANVYRGGLPNAQMGSGNPNMGRPPTAGVNSGIGQYSVPLSTFVGSLPPNQGNPDSTFNDALMALWRQKMVQNPGVS